MPIKLQIPKTLSIRHQIEAQKLERQLSEEWLKKHLIPVITQTSRVSIRLMDWLVTNYSKQYKVVYSYENGSVQRIFDLHYEYKTTLDSYGRPLFDPFRRGKRIFFTIDDNAYETTLGQLRFWLWCEVHGVIKFCSENADEIDNHMALAHHEREKKKKENKKRKRTSLSKPASGKCFIFPIQSTINFNDKT